MYTAMQRKGVKRNMKIGLFGTWISESRGGIENLCYNLFKGLQKSNDVKAFSLNVPDEDKFENDVYYANTSKRTVPVGAFLKAYRKQRKPKEFDTNIAIHWGPGLCTYIIKKIYGTPYCVYVMGKEVDYFKTPLHKWIVARILNNASNIITISEYTKELCRWVKNHNFALIHPGVDEAMFTVPEQPIVYNDGRFHIFGISRLVRRKGFQNVLKALPLLVQAGIDAEFTLAGGGEMETELRELVQELGLEDRVTFLGRISLEDKIKYMNACDLFAMPSYEIAEEREVEGFGIVYLEANAAGKFVIAGKDGGVPDAVVEGETGFLVDGNNPQAICEAIQQYYQKPQEEKQVLAQKCLHWAQEHRWDITAQKVQQLLEKGKV